MGVVENFAKARDVVAVVLLEARDELGEELFEGGLLYGAASLAWHDFGLSRVDLVTLLPESVSSKLSAEKAIFEGGGVGEGGVLDSSQNT